MATIYSSEFRAGWSRWYPGVVPFGYALGADYQERWLRVHSLPGSRRHPESAADWQQSLHRQNAAADAVVGGPTVVLASRRRISVLMAHQSSTPNHQGTETVSRGVPSTVPLSEVGAP